MGARFPGGNEPRFVSGSHLGRGGVFCCAHHNVPTRQTGRYQPAHRPLRYCPQHRNYRFAPQEKLAMPTHHGRESETPEAWHVAVENCLRRFDEDYRCEWKARFAAGWRFVVPVFLHAGPAETGSLLLSPGSYNWLPEDIWARHDPIALLDGLATCTGQMRGAGSDRLVARPTVEEDDEEDYTGAKLIGMGFAAPEWRRRHDPDCPDYQGEDDEELSESFYAAFITGDCYVRRYMGSDRAVMLRSYVDPADIDEDAMLAQAETGAFAETHLCLFDLLNANLCSPQSAKANYGEPGGAGGLLWLLTGDINNAVIYPN